MTQPGPSTPPEDKNEPPKNRITRDTDYLGGYFKVHSREIITYVLLILGIILLFFDALYGGILVGLVSGIYFGDEIVDYILHWKASIHSYGVARNLIIAGIAVAFFISAPAIFLGAAIAIGIKQLFVESGVSK